MIYYNHSKGRRKDGSKMEKIMFVAYMMENGFTFCGDPMDKVCAMYTMEELKNLWAIAMGEDPEE